MITRTRPRDAKRQSRYDPCLPAPDGDLQDHVLIVAIEMPTDSLMGIALRLSQALIALDVRS